MLSFIKTATAAISHFHLVAFNESPTVHPSAKRDLAAARCLLQKPVRQTAPIIPCILPDVHTIALADNSFLTWRTYWCMSMIFHILFCWSDLAAMRVRDVKFVPQAVQFTILRSKTDQIGQGATRRISTEAALPYCPVQLTKRYLDLLQSHCSGWLEASGLAVKLSVLFFKVPPQGGAREV